MNHEERVAKIEHYLNGLSYVSIKMTENGEADIKTFSWSPCNSCGSALGGYRFVFQGYIEELEEWTEWNSCENCAFEIEYPGERDCGDER